METEAEALVVTPSGTSEAGKTLDNELNPKRVFADIKNKVRASQTTATEPKHSEHVNTPTDTPTEPTMGPPTKPVKKRKRTSTSRPRADEDSSGKKIKCKKTKNLDYAGKALTGLEDARLPITPVTHDLAATLDKIVIISENPFKDVDEEQDEDIVELDLPLLASVASEEIRILRLSQRAFCSHFDISSGAFSVWMRAGEGKGPQGAKSWSTAGLSMKRFFYQLFLWLNLKPKDRISVFVPLPGLEPVVSSVSTIPEMDQLIKTALKEMEKHSITLLNMALSVVHEPVDVVSNMLFCPLYWAMTPLRLKHAYGRLWGWLMHPEEKRLSILVDVKVIINDERPELQYPDTVRLIHYVKAVANRRDITVMNLVEQNCKSFPRLTHKLVNKPKAWVDTDHDEKAVYVALMKWISSTGDTTPYEKTVPRRRSPTNKATKTPDANIPDPKPVVVKCEPFNEDDIESLVVMPDIPKPEIKEESDESEAETPLNTSTVAARMLAVIRSGLLTIKKFSQCTDVNRHYMGSLLRSPIQWSLTTENQRVVYRLARDFLDIKGDKERLEFIDKLIRKKLGIDEEVASPVKIVEEDPDALDTAKISKEMVKVVKKGQITFRRIAECLNINRNYLGACLRLPVPWSDTTLLQKIIYKTAKDFLAIGSLQSRIEFLNILAKENSNSSNSETTSNDSEVSPNDSSEVTNINDSVTSQEAEEVKEKDTETPMESTPETNGVAKKRQTRVKFTKEQSQILKETFAKDSKPTSKEKQELAEQLGLPLRTVMVYYMNHRRRLLAERRRAEMASVKQVEDELTRLNEPEDYVSKLPK